MTSSITKLRRPGEHLAPDEVSPLTDTVPIPVGPARPTRRYPFADMEIGDSFTFPEDRLASMRVALSLFRRQFRERLFTWRGEGRRGRVRVWRTE